MIWAAVAVLLVAWLIGLLLMVGPIVNLVLVAVGVLLVIQVIRQRDGEFD
jgi:hypothetical protein